MKMRTHEAAKAASTPTSAIPPQQSGLLLLRESEEADRSLLSSESWQRSPSSPTPIHPSSVGHRFGAMAIGPTTSPVLQRKLAIGQPNDRYEQEADQVADQVMRMPEPKIQRVCPECKEELQRQPMAKEDKKEDEETLQTKSLAESITPLIQRQTEPTEEEKEEEILQTKPLAGPIAPLIQRQTEPSEEDKREEEETLQTKPASGEPSTVSPALQNQITALQGGGQPLPESERHFFEPRFGTDFSQVRVHTDGQAAEAARAVNARAFTLGRDVVFGGGEYQPRSTEGQRLLAHELTHVVQQALSHSYKPYNNYTKQNSYSSSQQYKFQIRAEALPISRSIASVTRAMPMVQRRAAPYIKKITVHLTPSQNVDMEWQGTPPADAPGSDNFTVSTGKGYSDPEDPPGTCTRTCCSDTDTQCAPPWDKPSKVGACCTYYGNNFWTGKPLEEHNGWKWWTPIQPYYSSRGIALHEHHTVTGQPIGHGCVRMEESNAKRIYEYSNGKRTNVTIDGRAAPVACEADRQCPASSKSGSTGERGGASVESSEKSQLASLQVQEPVAGLEGVMS